MSDRNEKKRKRVASVDGQSANNTPRKIPKPTVDEIEPVQPPPRAPDTAAFYKLISTLDKEASATASGHKGYHYSAGLHEDFKNLNKPWSPTSNDNLVRPSPLSSADYEDGYISDDGDRFLKAIHAHKDREIAGAGALKEAKKKSRSGNTIRTGNIGTAPYHGVNISFRVDFTEIVEQSVDAQEPHDGSQPTDAPATKRWEPHVRLYAFKKDAKTKQLATFAEQIGRRGEEVQKQHFLAGVKGQPSPDGLNSDSYGTGVEFRAIGRASDAFGTVYPGIDGFVLSHPQTPNDVRNLFFHPELKTGGLGHQNTGPGATAEFNAFKEIVGNQRVEHSANKGTDIESVPLIRKANAINAAVPGDRPIIDITKRAK